MIFMNFLVLGHHRSGTSYVLDVIRHHPNVDTINEPFSMHLEFFRNDETSWDAEDYNPEYLHSALAAYPDTIDYIKELSEWMNSPFPNVRGFKETALIEKYYWLKKAVHFDRLFIVIRDPRAVIGSVIRRGLHNSWWDYAGRLKRFYSIKDGLDDPVSVCAQILKCRLAFLLELRESETCMVIKLEELLDDPVVELGKIMRYIDLDVHSEQIEFWRETSKETRDSAYSTHRGRETVENEWRKILSNSDREVVEGHLERELGLLGYR